MAGPAGGTNGRAGPRAGPEPTGAAGGADGPLGGPDPAGTGEAAGLVERTACRLPLAGLAAVGTDPAPVAGALGARPAWARLGVGRTGGIIGCVPLVPVPGRGEGGGAPSEPGEPPIAGCAPVLDSGVRDGAFPNLGPCAGSVVGVENGGVRRGAAAAGAGGAGGAAICSVVTAGLPIGRPVGAAGGVPHDGVGVDGLATGTAPRTCAGVGLAATGVATAEAALPDAMRGVGEAAAPAPTKSSSMTPAAPIAMTPPQTEQRARTPACGTLAGSTRKTERHSGQEMFMLPRFHRRRQHDPPGTPHPRPVGRGDDQSKRPTPRGSWRSSSFRSRAR